MVCSEGPGLQRPPPRASMPVESSRIELISQSPEETQAIGRLVGEHARPGDVFLLIGPLGSGKTCLAQGILWGLGSDEHARSPTFVLVSQYQGRLIMHHMDLYRLDTMEEIADLGIDEYLWGEGVCVVEWAEKASGMFPDQRLTVRMDVIGKTTRRLTLVDDNRRFAEVLTAVRPMTKGG